jgi:hypothetical protein
MDFIKRTEETKKKARKLRIELRDRYGKIAQKFNELFIEMDELLKEVEG